MKNKITESIQGLLTKAQDAVIGATLLGPIIMLAQNTAAAIGATVTALLNARNDYDNAKVSLRERRAEVAAAVRSARAFLTLFREVLKKVYGNRYSQLWDVTGFIGSLKISFKAEDLQPRIQKAETFLLANPDREVLALNITAAEASVLFTKLSEARTKVNEEIALVANRRAARDTAADNVKHRLRGLIQELSHILPPLDPRWKTFGFNMPGAQETPEAPLNLVAVLIGNNAISLKWDAAPRAEYYRVSKRVVGVDTEFVAVGIPADLDFTLEGLPSNKDVELVVSAVNNGGESEQSVIATVKTL